MSNQLLNLINGIGVMTELWIIAYNGFKKQGLDDKDALSHTKEFMSLMMDSVLRMTDGQKESESQ